MAITKIDSIEDYVLGTSEAAKCFQEGRHGTGLAITGGINNDEDFRDEIEYFLVDAANRAYHHIAEKLSSTSEKDAAPPSDFKKLNIKVIVVVDVE